MEDVPNLNIRTRRVRLETVLPAHVDFVRSLLLDPEIAGRHRFGHLTPTPSDLDRAIWDRASLQYVVVRNRDDRPVGLQQLTDLSLLHGTARIVTIMHPTVHHSPWLLEGSALFIKQVFDRLPIRKLYGEVIEFNYQQFSSGADRLFEIEGRLKDHEWHHGRLWDAYIIALTREMWETSRTKRLIERSVQMEGRP